MRKIFNSTVLFYLIAAAVLAMVLYPAPFLDFYEEHVEPMVDKAAVRWVEWRELELVKETEDAESESRTE